MDKKTRKALEAKAAAQAELDFLRSLRPSDEAMAAAHPQQTRADLSPDGTGQPGCAAAATDKDED